MNKPTNELKFEWRQHRNQYHIHSCRWGNYHLRCNSISNQYYLYCYGKLLCSGYRLIRGDVENIAIRHYLEYGGVIGKVDLQGRIGEWAEKTFPDSTADSVIAHFMEEAVELYDAPIDPIEAADCVMLLFHLAHKLGYDLLDEVEKKLKINQKRKWNTEPNDAGYFKHQTQQGLR